MDKDYLYRIDTIRTLKSIQRKGFKCGTPSRLTQFGLKSETEQALEEGLPVPPAELLDKPRGYFFETLEHAEYELTCLTSYDFISRYSRRMYPFSDDALVFPDGALRRGAVYVIFQDLVVTDIAVLPENIEIWVNDAWYKLKEFDFDSLTYIKCSICRELIPKKIVQEPKYKGKFWCEKFYCETCCLPLKTVYDIA